MTRRVKFRDDLDLQMGIASTALNELSRLLRKHGYNEKANEAKGGALLTLQWLHEYQREQAGGQP